MLTPLLWKILARSSIKCKHYFLARSSMFCYSRAYEE